MEPFCYNAAHAYSESARLQRLPLASILAVSDNGEIWHSTHKPRLSVHVGYIYI